MKKVPIRTCVGCGEAKPKQELVRIVRDAEGKAALDSTSRQEGRGAYLCLKDECLASAVKRGRIERSLKVSLTEKEKAALVQEFKEYAKKVS